MLKITKGTLKIGKDTVVVYRVKTKKGVFCTCDEKSLVKRALKKI